MLTITIRHGIAEVVEGAPIPCTPGPVAVLRLHSRDFREMAVKRISPFKIWAQGRIRAQGSWVKALAFLRCFETSS